MAFADEALGLESEELQLRAKHLKQREEALIAAETALDKRQLALDNHDIHFATANKARHDDHIEMNERELAIIHSANASIELKEDIIKQREDFLKGRESGISDREARRPGKEKLLMQWKGQVEAREREVKGTEEKIASNITSVKPYMPQKHLEDLTLAQLITEFNERTEQVKRPDLRLRLFQLMQKKLEAATDSSSSLTEAKKLRAFMPMMEDWPADRKFTDEDLKDWARILKHINHDQGDNKILKEDFLVSTDRLITFISTSIFRDTQDQQNLLAFLKAEDTDVELNKPICLQYILNGGSEDWQGVHWFSGACECVVAHLQGTHGHCPVMTNFGGVSVWVDYSFVDAE